MKGASKVIMGATLVMILSLAIVLALVLVLLAELYCSLRRRRQLTLTKSPTPTPTTTTSIAASTHVPSSLTSFYSHGVLFPRLATTAAAADVERPHGKLHHFLSLQTLLDSAVNSPAPSPPAPVYVPSPPSPSRHSLSTSRSPPPQKAAAFPPLLDMQSDLRTAKEHLVYISNPIFDNDSGAAQALPCAGDDTPFETPDTSPSRLLKDGGRLMTPPLTPIKDLPTKACSITLSDARSLGPSGSDSNSQNAAFSPTYSGSPSTSPSW